MSDTARLLAGKKPLSKRVLVVLDPDAAERFEEARLARNAARHTAGLFPDDPDALWRFDEAEKTLAAARDDLEVAGVAWFTFRAVGRAAYEKLLARHRPSEEQLAEARTLGLHALAWNHETFPPAVVAASLAEPELSIDDAQAMWDSPDWNQAELQALLEAAVEVNGTRRTVDFKGV